MTPHAEIEIAGQRLLLRADRSVYWPAAATLLVADTHFGKGGVFRRAGLGLPQGTTQTDLARLEGAIEATGARRLVVLGDFMHAPLQPGEAWTQAFAAWRARKPDIELVVTRGNHDRDAALPAAFDVHWQAGRRLELPFVFMHEPAADARGPTLAGHLHPVVRLTAGRERLRAPVFWRHAHGLLLPAFSSFAGGTRIDPAPGDRLYAVGHGQVVALRTAPCRGGPR